LIWSGDADLDLEVKEPIGTLCNFQNRQTPGGGILIGDHLTERSRESYRAAQAFAGEYQVVVRRVWGQPVGNKATLKITVNQGTANESVRLETVTIDRPHTTKVDLAAGRRTSVAQVPPTTSRAKSTAGKDQPRGDTLTKLRNLADPTLDLNTGMRGGFASGIGGRDAPPSAPVRDRGEPASYQNRVASVHGGMEWTAKATRMSDGTYGMSMSPVFQTMSRMQGTPVVNLPLIPGAKDRSMP
jgi:hypothetical protein